MSVTYGFFAVACALTWLLGLPAAMAWTHHEAPPPFAVACAGISAFGPLLAALVFAIPAKAQAAMFGHFRASPRWIVLALAAPFVIHVIATALYVMLGGHPAKWVHPPVTAEAIAALVVFPLGEEFGWRGFAYPRMVERFGLVRGSLGLGIAWGAWHLMYSVTPQAAAFDPFVFGLGMVELPLYSLLIAWVFERSNRSMAVALAFHAGAHLDHFEQTPKSELGLHVFHVIVLGVIAFVAARSLRARSRAGQTDRRAGVAP